MLPAGEVVYGALSERTKKKYSCEIALYLRFLAKLGKKQIEIDGNLMAQFIEHRREEKTERPTQWKSLKNCKIDEECEIPNIYKNSKKIKFYRQKDVEQSVPALVQQWFFGSAEHLSIVERDRRFKSHWRKESSTRNLYNKERKLCYSEFECYRVS